MEPNEQKLYDMTLNNVRSGDGDMLRTIIAKSQAVSLKRIADALEAWTDHRFNEPSLRVSQK